MVNLPTLSTSHFVNFHFVISHFVNIDQMGIDKMGIDKVGINPDDSWSIQLKRWQVILETLGGYFPSSSW